MIRHEVVLRVASQARHWSIYFPPAHSYFLFRMGEGGGGGIGTRSRSSVHLNVVYGFVIVYIRFDEVDRR